MMRGRGETAWQVRERQPQTDQVPWCRKRKTKNSERRESSEDQLKRGKWRPFPHFPSSNFSIAVSSGFKLPSPKRKNLFQAGLKKVVRGEKTCSRCQGSVKSNFSTDTFHRLFTCFASQFSQSLKFIHSSKKISQLIPHMRACRFRRPLPFNYSLQTQNKTNLFKNLNCHQSNKSLKMNNSEDETT